MKTHKQLDIPEITAWNSKNKGQYLRYHLPSWLIDFFDSIVNLFKWFPIIYKDKNWDQYYIYEIIKFKLINQQNYLIKANRHVLIPQVNRDITTCLNLIERLQSDYYDMEYMNYCDSDFNWVNSLEHQDYKELHIIKKWEDFHPLFQKYPRTTKKLIKECSDDILSENTLALTLCSHNQNKAQTLLFKILNERINHWWD